MSERPTFDRIYTELALSLARRSECGRLQVGCVIASLDGRRVYGVGYNGQPAGSARRCRGADAPAGTCGCVHAEANAIANAEMRRADAKVALVTTMPCAACATLLVNVGGVARVLWDHEYRLSEGAEILREAGIDARNWRDAGGST